MSKVSEYEQELNNLWGKLKRNCVGVGSKDILKEKYPSAYNRLIVQIRGATSRYLIELFKEKNWRINKDYIQTATELVIRMLRDSRVIKKICKKMQENYSTEGVPEMVEQFYQECKAALWKYNRLLTELVIDPDSTDETIIYNRVTQEVYENDRWVHRELDLTGKFIVRFSEDIWKAYPQSYIIPDLFGLTRKK